MRAAFRAVDSGLPGGGAGADHDPRRPAPRDLPAPLRGLRRHRRAALAPALGKELRPLVQRRRGGQGRHPDRHPPRALEGRRASRRLGLLVVDEEQRFGVAQKEKLKQLKKDVHVLAMSATPLPRTLQLSLAGVRDLSVIETPPKDRMAVETAVLPYSERAGARGDRVRARARRAGLLRLQPGRVDRADGRRSCASWCPGCASPSATASSTSASSSGACTPSPRGEYDLLLASTIIENGIDIPNVNTMIVHRADRFGLAQLYQLRGRVGRSSRELGYCYLLVPSPTACSPRRRASGSRRCASSPSSAPASASRRATSRSAAPATCSAPSRAATSPSSASRPT